MASARSQNHSTRSIEKSCRSCSESNEKIKKQECSPYLEKAVSKFEERRGDLVNRQQFLRQKITTMERSIPALIAFNMLNAGENSGLDSPLCKVKRIMNKLSPHRDPTDKLLNELRNTVKSLNGETAELHDKIIATDIKLEESEMELESLELANEELGIRLKGLEEELARHGTPSLHSIHSDDLVCLSKIRQLGEAELRLKNGIRELEERESLFHRQMDSIFKSREFRKASCSGITKKIRQLECNERRMNCALHAQICNVQQLKKKMLQNEEDLDPTIEISTMSANKRSGKETNPAKVSDSQSNFTFRRHNAKKDKLDREKSASPHRHYEKVSVGIGACRTSALMARYDESSCPATSDSHAPDGLESACNALRFCETCMGPMRSRCVLLASELNASRGQDCASASTRCADLLKPPCRIKTKSWIGNSSVAAPLSSKANSVLSSPSSHHQEPASYDRGTLSTECQGFKLRPRCLEQGNYQPNDCRCSCRGKCATGVSGVTCNCADYTPASVDKKNHEQSDNPTEVSDKGSTDEEYCECCNCSDCDSDLSDTVQC